MLVHMPLIYVDDISDDKVESCFGVLFDFLLFEKMDQKMLIKFCVKNYMKCARTFEILTVYYEQNINSIVI